MTDLRSEIESLFQAHQSAWAVQGRDDTMQWAVENFKTGQGQIFFDKLVALVREREKAAVEEAFERWRTFDSSGLVILDYPDGEYDSLLEKAKMVTILGQMFPPDPDDSR